MAAKFLIDEPSEAKTNDHLQQYSPKHKMSGGLHKLPDVIVCQNILVLSKPDELNGRIAICFEVGEGKIDRPEQRKNIDRQKQKHRRRNEEPGNSAL